MPTAIALLTALTRQLVDHAQHDYCSVDTLDWSRAHARAQRHFHPCGARPQSLANSLLLGRSVRAPMS
eukprot:1211454-Pyramimonas_sp.AAC.1